MFLSLNSKGNEVVQLQNKLNSLGFNSGIADGIFGPNTRDAVKRFQAANGLSQDGIVTNTVWNKLNPATAKLSSGISMPKIISPKLNMNFLKNKNVIIVSACLLILAAALIKKKSMAKA